METAGITFILTTSDNVAQEVYISGTFNNWAAGDPAFRMESDGPHRFTFFLPESQLSSFPVEYKYTRGSWGSVELDTYGANVPNRQLAEYAKWINDEVPRWKNNGIAYNPALKHQPQIISEYFKIPQLIKTRRITALLPHDYYETDRRYPVLYLQDGQNLFDEYAPFGSWAVDKRMAILAERGTSDLIIIAIDHAKSERIAEFTPSYKTILGPGDGKRYARFLADTLKPYIDQNFRTLSDQQHTGIGGSSMGALISIYAALMYPEVYSKLLIFSPSLWVAPNIHFNAIRFVDPVTTRIYLYAGGRESQNMIPNITRFQEALEKNGQDGSRVEFRLSIDPEGQHNEARWGREFPKAIEWLFFPERQG